MVGLRDPDRGGLDGRVRGEVGADQAAVPRPVVLGVARRVHADPAAPALEPALERALLRLVEDVAGGEQEDDHVEAGQIAIGEAGRVLGVLECPAALGRQSAQRLGGRLDRLVAKAGRAAEGEHADRLGRLGHRILRLVGRAGVRVGRSGSGTAAGVAGSRARVAARRQRCERERDGERGARPGLDRR